MNKNDTLGKMIEVCEPSDIEHYAVEVYNATSAEVDDSGDVYVIDAGGGHWLDDDDRERLARHIYRAGHGSLDGYPEVTS